MCSNAKIKPNQMYPAITLAVGKEGFDNIFYIRDGGTMLGTNSFMITSFASVLLLVKQIEEILALN